MAVATCLSCCFFSVVFVYGFHWLAPCKPSLFGYFLLKECKYSRTAIMIKNSILYNLFKFLLFAVSVWMFTFSAFATTFAMGNIQILCNLTIKHFLQRYWSLVKSGRLLEPGIALMYRNIQILAKIGNEIQQRSFMMAMVLVAMAFLAGCTPLLIITPFHSDNLMALGTFGVLIFHGYLVVVVFLGGMASIYRKSNEVRRHFYSELHVLGGGEKTSMEILGRSKTNHRPFKWKRCFLQSCPLIKIRFGSLYFVDELTPLNIVNLSNDLSVQVLLMTSKQVHA